MYTELQLVTWILLISITKAETRIEVTESTCGGDFNLDDVGSLDLDYYGAFLGKGQVIDRLLTHNKKCVFNIHSTNYTGRQICISASVKGYYNSFACGIYFRYYLGSRNDSKTITAPKGTRHRFLTHVGKLSVTEGGRVRKTVVDTDEQSRVSEENERLRRKIMCRHCKTEPRSILILGCKHLVLCDKCHRLYNNCPLCGQLIKAFLDVLWA